MTSSLELSELRELQVLREKRAENELAIAMVSRRDAREAHELADTRLEKAAQALEDTFGQSPIGLGQLLLVSAHVSQLARDAEAKRAELIETDTRHSRAQAAWQLTKCGREKLDEQVAKLARKERRREDDRREIDALSRHVPRGVSEG